MLERKIVHVDVDAFFAAVEQVLDPALKGRPVLVGRGVVASASYEAKAQGVRTAMTVRQALRICPDAVLVAGKYENYAAMAGRLRHILEGYSPAVEATSLDDFYVDFTGTGRLYPHYAEILHQVQDRVERDLGLTVSLGAAANKTVAGIASRLHRPRGFAMVPPGQEEAFLAPLPVEKLPGVGPSHRVTLEARGITTIGQLRLLPREMLEATFGEVIGRQLYDRARGVDARAVEAPRLPKSVSRETTVEKGTIDPQFLCGLLEYLAERIGTVLRGHGLEARTLLLKLRYVDGLAANRAASLHPGSNDSKELAAAAADLLEALFTRRVAVRFVGLAALRLVPESRQNHLFDPRVNRRWYLNRNMDRLRSRYGWNSVGYGNGLELRQHYRTYENGLVLSTPCLSR